MRAPENEIDPLCTPPKSPSFSRSRYRGWPSLASTALGPGSPRLGALSDMLHPRCASTL